MEADRVGRAGAEGSVSDPAESCRKRSLDRSSFIYFRPHSFMTPSVTTILSSVGLVAVVVVVAPTEVPRGT